MSLAACAPPATTATPCNTDDDCAPADACLQGLCARGAQHPDASVPPGDAADPPPEDEDAGPVVVDDAGAHANDSGIDDAGAPTDGGPLPDAGAVDAGPPAIVSFEATPSSVTLGSTVTLTWVGKDLESCRLEGHEGSLAASGSLVIERPATRPYTLRCTDAAGDEHVAEESVSVTCTELLTLAELVVSAETEAAPFPAGSCVSVTGNVTVQNVSGSDLTGLYGLTNVGGYLTIAGNPNLTSLGGLEMLATVGGDLRLGLQEASTDPLLTNPALRAVHGLSALTDVGVDLEVLEQDALLSLDGLERLSSIGSDLELYGSDVLERVDALHRLTTIGDDLDVNGCPALSSLKGLEGLTAVGRVLLSGNASLVDVTALSNVVGEISAVYIHNNDSLETLDGLSGITGLRAYLQVQYNDALQRLDGLASLGYTERVLVRGNAALQDVDLPALEKVVYEGEQTCSGSTPFCDGMVVLYQNDALTTVSGFHQLVEVGDVRVIDNEVLTTLSGFSSLASVRNDLVIENNAALWMVLGFPLLADVDDLDVVGNPALEVLSLPALSVVRDDLIVTDNDSLPDLGGFSGLTSVGGSLVIDGNASLAQLGLSALSGIGDYPTCARGCLVHVRNNASLPQAQVDAFVAEQGRPVDALDEANLDLTNNAP